MGINVPTLGTSATMDLLKHIFLGSRIVDQKSVHTVDVPDPGCMKAFLILTAGPIKLGCAANRTEGETAMVTAPVALMV